MKSHTNGRGGFTLIELIVVIVIAGTLSSVAVVRYRDLRSATRQAVTKESLAAMRSAIVLYQTAQAVQTGTPRWPTYAQFRTPGTVLVGKLPPNPYQATNRAPDSVINGNSFPKGRTRGNRGGWVYKQSTGEIWANTTTSRSNTW
ncbi:MAG: type II secretion system protein [Candidatus Zixiibacteriota bacterium]